MDTWDTFQHWNLVIPPSRPSTEQLAAVRQSIGYVERTLPVAILGSTPEFRDLVFEMGYQDVSVLDKNQSFHDLMTALRVHQSEEKLILGDWAERLPMFRNTFGLILSDLTSGNVPYEHRQRFYNAIENALRPGGIFVDKILTHPGPHIPLDTLFTKYDQIPLNLLSVNRFSCEVLFCSTLLNHRNLVDSTLFYRILDADAPTARLRAFARQARYITPEGGIWHYGLPWADLESTYCPGLTRSEICWESPTSPYCDRVRHFIFVREV